MAGGVPASPGDDTGGPTSSTLVPILTVGVGRSGSTLTMAALATNRSIAFDRRYPFEARYLTYLVEHAELLGPQPDRTRAQKRTPEAAQSGSATLARVEALARAARTRAARLLRSAFSDGHAPRTPPTRTALKPLLANDTDIWRRGLDAEPTLATDLLRIEWPLMSRVIAQGYLASQTSSSASRRDEPVAYAEKVRWQHARLITVAIDARLIIRLRDPRDVWASIAAFDDKRGFFGFGRGKTEPVDDYFARWLEMQADFLAWVRDEGDGPDRTVLRYEELVGDLDGSCRRIEELIGLELDPQAALRSTASFLDEHTTSTSPEESVGRYRQDLSLHTRRQFDDRLGDLLEHFGFA